MAGYGALPRSCPRTLRVATAFVGATTRTAWFWGTVSLLSTLGPAMVVIAATLAVSPASGTPGQTMLTINGSGFPPGNVTLTIRDDSATAGSGLLVGGNGTTNATVDGVLSPAFQAILNPGVSNGRKKIDALDGALNVIASVDFLVGVESRLTVRNGADEISQGTVGTLLTVAPSVATFGASENVEVFFANQSIILQQAINGTFTTNFAVPLMPGGPKQIRAVGRTTGRTLTANFQLIPNITSISESLFDLGETLTITGSGAGAGDSLQVMLATAKDDSPLEDAVVDTSAPVTITAGGAADTSGIFQLTFRVDNRIFDKDRTQVRLRVISVSAGVESAWFGKDSEIPGGLEIITKGVRLTLNQTSGAGDATLTVTGFAADDSGNARLSANIGSVTVQHQFVSSGQRVVVPSSDLTVNVGLKEGDTVRTDFSGKFEVTFPIGTASQPKPGGLLTVSISGENVNYTITPQLRVTDSGGVPRSWVRPGSGFTLEGTGYFPLQNVVATFDGSPLQTSSTPRTDTFGRFTTTFGVSESIPRGTYMLRGADPFSSASITLQLLEGVNSPPVAAAGDNISAYEGGETAFDGSSSTDDTGVVGYAWDFGDGTTAEGVAATHVYSTLGTYIVTLTVVDSDGEMDTDQVAVTVVPPFTFRRHWVFDPAPGGDGNRTATRGERVTAQVRLLNAAWPLGQDVRVALMLVSPWTVVTRHTVTHAAWSIGEARTSGFRVELADDAPPTDIGGIIEIASADGRSWTLPVTFTISRAPVTFDLVDDWLFDPEPGGNRDGQANPGESLRPRIRLSHVGSEDGADVRVSMRTDDPDLTLVISEVTHLSWPAGASRNNDGLLMSVSPTAITHDAVVTVEVCAEGVPTQTFTLTIPIIAPPMPMAKRNAWIYDPPPHGNLDGVANAGETVQPRIRLKLGGVETLRNVRVSLLVTDPDIAVGVGEVVHDVWSPGEARNNDGLLLSIAPNATAHDLHIPVRVTADGRDPWETVLNLRIAESPIAFESRRAWVFDPDGNRDGLAQPGERIRPRFRIKHVGESAAHNVQVTLTSDDPRITIAQGVLRHSVWPAGEGRNSDGVEIDVSPSAPARDVLFTAHVTADNGGSWEFTFTLPIAPQFALRNAWIYDPPPRGNGDGVANAGETVQPRIRLRNDGPETLRNVRVSLLSGASDITAQTGEVVHDVWAPGEAKNSNGLMLAIARGATARDVQMPVRVTADGREPWETILAFSIEESPLRFESRTAWSFDAEPGGNRDGIAQAGERVAPRFRMRHAGESDAHNVTVEITTSDDVVRIVQSEVRHATWPAGAARNNVGLVFDVAKSATPHDVSFVATVTADNGGPWQFTYTLPIGATPTQFVLRNAWAYDPAPGGDKDGEANPGERVLPRVRMKNVGQQDAENVRVTITVRDSAVTVAEGVVAHATWPAGVARNNNGFVLALTDAAGPGDLDISVDVTADNGGPWHFTATLPVVARPPNMVVRNAWAYDPAPDGNHDGQASPGEQVLPRLRMRNEGQQTATNVTVAIAVADPSITVIEGVVTHSEWAARVARNNNGFVVDIADDTTASEIEIVADITADNGGPWQLTVRIPIRAAQAADLNADGVVTIADVLVAATLYGEDTSSHEAADLNADNRIDLQDLALVAYARDGVSNGAPAVSRPTYEAVVDWIEDAHRADDGSAVFRDGISALADILRMLRPEATALLPNYPNPFNPDTWIPFDLSEASEVAITIYDARGRRVRRIDLGYRAVGTYRDREQAAYWDGANDSGEPAASGVYIYELRSRAHRKARRMVIRK